VIGQILALLTLASKSVSKENRTAGRLRSLYSFERAWLGSLIRSSVGGATEFDQNPSRSIEYWGEREPPPQNKTPQTHPSHGTLGRTALPRKLLYRNLPSGGAGVNGPIRP
jgi:hypothetical protein